MGTLARVEQAVRRLIQEAGPGNRLPSERALADGLEASRTSVRFVLARLAAEGLIRPEQGRGYFVV